MIKYIKKLKLPKLVYVNRKNKDQDLDKKTNKLNTMMKKSQKSQNIYQKWNK